MKSAQLVKMQGNQMPPKLQAELGKEGEAVDW